MDNNQQHLPIGVFDSGLGGLTVVKALRQQLPHEDIIYFGDTARVPYGIKSAQAIVRFSIENTQFLLEQNVKAVVVACNSSSSYALGALRKTFAMPIIGVIQSGAFKALECTVSRSIGVLATRATIESGAYQNRLKEMDSNISVIAVACPLLVPLVEEGWLDHHVTESVLETYFENFQGSGVDAVILGCTHYPLLIPAIERITKGQVILIDSAQSVAGDVSGVLTRQQLRNPQTQSGSLSIFVSDQPQGFKRIARTFLGFDVDVKCVNVAETADGSITI